MKSLFASVLAFGLSLSISSSALAAVVSSQPELNFDDQRLKEKLEVVESKLESQGIDVEFYSTNVISMQYAGDLNDQFTIQQKLPPNYISFYFVRRSDNPSKGYFSINVGSSIRGYITAEYIDEYIAAEHQPTYLPQNPEEFILAVANDTGDDLITTVRQIEQFNQFVAAIFPFMGKVILIVFSLGAAFLLFKFTYSVIIIGRDTIKDIKERKESLEEISAKYNELYVELINQLNYLNGYEGTTKTVYEDYTIALNNSYDEFQKLVIPRFISEELVKSWEKKLTEISRIESEVKNYFEQYKRFNDDLQFARKYDVDISFLNLKDPLHIGELLNSNLRGIRNHYANMDHCKNLIIELNDHRFNEHPQCKRIINLCQQYIQDDNNQNYRLYNQIVELKKDFQTLVTEYVQTLLYIKEEIDYAKSRNLNCIAFDELQIDDLDLNKAEEVYREISELTATNRHLDQKIKQLTKRLDDYLYRLNKISSCVSVIDNKKKELKNSILLIKEQIEYLKNVPNSSLFEITNRCEEISIALTSLEMEYKEYKDRENSISKSKFQRDEINKLNNYLSEMDYVRFDRHLKQCNLNHEVREKAKKSRTYSSSSSNRSYHSSSSNRSHGSRSSNRSHSSRSTNRGW